MFLVLSSKHFLPTVFPEGVDDKTYVWSGNTKEPLLYSVKTPFFVDVHIARPISIPWRRVPFDCSEIIVDRKIRTYSVDAMEFVMQISYIAHYSKNTEHMSIESITLQLRSVAFLSQWIAEEKHRIVATIKRDRRTDRLLLGRAQSIQTVGEMDTRQYVWKSILDAESTSLSLNESPPPFGISPRLEDNRSSEVDHDGFSNPFSAFPIQIEENSIVTIHFFNLKDRPPRFVEWSIRWGSLVEQMTPPPSPLMRRLSTLKPKNNTTYVFREQITQQMEAKVTFKQNKDGTILLENIQLIVSNYRDALELMNSGIVPKTL
jgi:hypothetical protein